MRGCSFAENFVTEARVSINNGTVTGSGIVIERLVTFDGTQHVDFDIVSQALPASAVVRFSAAATSTGILLANANLIAGTPDDGFCIWVDATGVKATYSDGVAIETALSVPIDYTTGAVFTATYVFTATSHTLYVDAETPDTGVTTTTGPIGATTAVMVGGDGSDDFTGTIYNPRIFNATLTAGEHALYYGGTLTSFIGDAYAKYSCDDFGEDTTGNKIWDTSMNERDLIKGDGSTSSLMPTLVEYTAHSTDYYTFDGVDDYVSSWPTMPATYTVSAALSTAYPTAIPYIQQVNDATIQTLLTTGGSFTGNLHNLVIFEGVLEQIQLYHLEWIQLSRLYRETNCNAYVSRLIVEGTCTQAYFFEDPINTLHDYSDLDTTQTQTDASWDNGLEFAATTSEISTPDEAGLRSDKVTVHVVGDFNPDTTQRFMIFKEDNYEFSIYTSGPYTILKLNNKTSSNLTLTSYSSVSATCKDGDSVEFYVNGASVGSSLSGTTIDETSTEDQYIGNDETGSNEFLDTIKKLFVFNAVLAPTEIAVLHDLTLPEDVPDTTPAITDVDTDDIIDSTQTNVVLTGTNLGATEGKLYLANDAALGFASIVVEQSIDSWADTSIQFDVTPGTLLD